MRRATAFLIASFIAGPTSAQTPAPSIPSVTLPAPLARVLTDYEAAWQGKDAAALAALFTEDGFVLSSGTPPIRGRAQIEKHYAGQGGPLALRALAFDTEGSLGYIIGGFARATGEPDIGKFTLTLRKAGGRWMIVSDMDNANARREAADVSVSRWNDIPPASTEYAASRDAMRARMGALLDSLRRR